METANETKIPIRKLSNTQLLFHAMKYSLEQNASKCMPDMHFDIYYIYISDSFFTLDNAIRSQDSSVISWIYWVVARTCQCDGAAVIHFGLLLGLWLFHSGCRLTPFPVRMVEDCRDVSQPCWEQFMIDIVPNPESYHCLDESLWLSSGPQDCTWPIDKEDVRVRSLDNRGDHSCSKPVEFMSSLSMELYNTDGPRFINPDEPYGIDRTQRLQLTLSSIGGSRVLMTLARHFDLISDTYCE